LLLLGAAASLSAGVLLSFAGPQPAITAVNKNRASKHRVKDRFFFNFIILSILSVFTFL
jgi:hypothetical protein